MESIRDLRAICQTGKESDPGWYAVHRHVSIYVTWLLLHTPLTPNQITLIMMGVAAIGAWLLASPALAWNLAGFGLLYAAFLLDKADGEVARYRNQRSVHGIMLDRLHHLVIEPAIVFAAAWREYQATGGAGIVIAALVAIVIGNVLEEQPHWPAYALLKHLREGRRMPAPRSGAASWLARAYPAFRALKAFRMFIVVLATLAVLYVVQAWTGRPVVAGYLWVMTAALGVYLVFQSLYYHAFKLDEEIAITRSVWDRDMNTETPPEADRATARRIARFGSLGTIEGGRPERAKEGLRSTT